MRLLNGSTIPDDSVSFDEATYHFSYGAKDITNEIPRTEKLRFVPGFDVERENLRLSDELGSFKGDGQTKLDESTASIFIDQITHDPLGAPLEALDKGVKQLFDSTGFKTLFVLGLVVIAIAVYAKTE